MTSVHTTMLDNLFSGTWRDIGIQSITVQWMLQKQDVSGLDSASLEQDPAEGSGEDGIKSHELYDQLRNYQLQTVAAHLLHH